MNLPQPVMFDVGVTTQCGEMLPGTLTLSRHTTVYNREMLKRDDWSCSHLTIPQADLGSWSTSDFFYITTSV